MNLTKNFASRRQSWRDSWQDCTEIFATVNLLLGENLGKICGGIPARFWPPGSLLPSENLGKIRGGIPPRFWPPGFFLLGENLGEIHGKIPARFWPPGFLLPGGNLAEIRGRIPVRFWPPGISFPGEIPAGHKNPSGQNLAGIPTGFLPRSRQDPAKIPVLILQGQSQGEWQMAIMEIATQFGCKVCSLQSTFYTDQIDIQADQSAYFLND